MTVVAVLLAGTQFKVGQYYPWAYGRALAAEPDGEVAMAERVGKLLHELPAQVDVYIAYIPFLFSQNR